MGHCCMVLWSNGFASTKASDNAYQARKELEPVKDYILLPLWTADPPFSPRYKEYNRLMLLVQKQALNFYDPNMSALEDVSIFNFSRDDDDDVGGEADINNLDTTIQISPIPTTRIHKDHPLDQEEPKKVEKHCYGLHQAPRALDMETLSHICWIMNVKTASIPMETQKPLLKDKDGEEVDVHMYRCKKSTVGANSQTESSEGFEQIVDFLNANPIRYALMINPTIYISCIEQFWSTVKAKTVNGEVQLHALVDGKKIIITESTVRRDLQLEGVKMIVNLLNSTIFEQLILMGNTSVGGSQAPRNHRGYYCSNRFETVPTSNDPCCKSTCALKSVKPKVKANVVEEPSVPVSAASTKVSAATTTTTATIPTPRKGIVVTELGTSTTITTISSQHHSLGYEHYKLSDYMPEFDEGGKTCTEKMKQCSLTKNKMIFRGLGDADYQLAQRLQAKEQEQFTTKQKATLFKELLEQRRKHFAAKRAKEKSNKQPNKTQQKKTMITYLKNMEGWKHKDLKS
ncbi:hypothetical protein Tco_1345758 [Tanacetum coccineum]